MQSEEFQTNININEENITTIKKLMEENDINVVDEIKKKYSHIFDSEELGLL